MAEVSSKSRSERLISVDEDIFQCSICHNEMTEVSITQCGHPFCTGCIKKWIARFPNCPQCRRLLFNYNLIDGRYLEELNRKYKELLDKSERDHQQQREVKESFVTSYFMKTLKENKKLKEEFRQTTNNLMTVIEAQSDDVRRENVHLNTMLRNTKEKLETMQQERLQLEDKVRHFKMYEKLHEDTSARMKFYMNTVLPNKDSTIAELQRNITELLGKVAVLSQNNIPLNEHVKILQTQLKQTTQQLRQYFEDEYGTKIATLEKQNEFIKKHLKEKEAALHNLVDVGDELKTATRTYKKLIKENGDLRDEVKAQERRIKQLTLDVTYSTERANKLERKVNFYQITGKEE